MADDVRFSRPLYTVSEAARYVGMAPSTFRSWSKGYHQRRAAGPDVIKGPVITSVASESPQVPSIPFGGLVEATVVQAFRATALPLQRVRKALEILQSQGELEHPLASKRLYSDGAQVLYEYCADDPTDPSRLLTVVVSGQRVFHEVIASYLQLIEFDGDSWALGLVLPVTKRPLLRVRPHVAFGEPLFVNGGAPFSAVRSRFLAGEPARSIAKDYGVPERDITEAVQSFGLSAAA